MTPKPTIFTKVVEPMNKEARNLVLYLLAMFAATWTTYFMIVFNGWDP